MQYGDLAASWMADFGCVCVKYESKNSMQEEAKYVVGGGGPDLIPKGATQPRIKKGRRAGWSQRKNQILDKVPMG